MAYLMLYGSLFFMINRNDLIIQLELTKQCLYRSYNNIEHIKQKSESAISQANLALAEINLRMDELTKYLDLLYRSKEDI